MTYNIVSKKNSKIIFFLKIIRYIKMYGFERTYIKIQGKLHLNFKHEFQGNVFVNQRCKDFANVNRNVALIGCGNFAFTNISFYLRKFNKNFLRYTFDIDNSKSLSLCKYYNGAFATTDIKLILDDPNVKIVFIASNHHSHAEYAIEFLKKGKHVHIEKPHVVSNEQLVNLLNIKNQYPSSKIFLGFNRPKSRIYNILKTHLDTQIGPIMLNWFIVGHEISDNHWYNNKKEGGRILGNLSHWTDLTLNLINLDNAFPCIIKPISSPNSLNEFIVTLFFADNSIGTLTFSAKGATFEGVRELLVIHKGDLYGILKDFEILNLDISDKKISIRNFYRDHGHKANIFNTMLGINSDNTNGESINYIELTAKLFLGVKKAIETQNNVTINI